MRTIGSTLQNSPQVASFPSSSSSPTKWCRSSSLPFLGLGRSVTAMIRNEDDGCWYIPYIDWISRYCILYTYDKIYMMVYIYIPTMFFSWCSSTQKNKFLMVVNDLEPYADEAVFFLLLVQLVECSHVLLALSRSFDLSFGWNHQMVVLGDHIESTASIRRIECYHASRNSIWLEP